MNKNLISFLPVAFCLSLFICSCSTNVNNAKQNSADTTAATPATTTVASDIPGPLWSLLDNQNLNVKDSTSFHYKKYKLFALDSLQMRQFLLSSPSPKNRNQSSPHILEIPRPDSGFMKFSIYTTSVMDSALEAKFPLLKTYGGQGIDERSAMIRLDFNQNGFHGFVISQAGEWFIEPSAKGITHQSLVCFFKQDAITPNRSSFELPGSPVK